MAYHVPPLCPHTGKLIYDDLVDATRWAGLWGLKYGKKQYPYPCTVGGLFMGHFHTTTHRNRKTSYRRKLQRQRSKARIELALAQWENEGGTAA